MRSEFKNESYLVVDVDDLVTKAILIDRSNGNFSIRGASEASTTVDSPDLDVTIGIGKACKNLGQKVDRELWGVKGPSRNNMFLCSSSTGGSLYMMVAGVMSMISAESAQRAALGAGALLVDVFSKDDARPEFKMVEQMRSLKPDMFLLAGGTDGGAVEQVLELAHLIRTADVKPRFGSEFKLPIIYAGNIEIRERVLDTLSKDRYAATTVDNVRPIMERENLGPAKEAIYDLFMEHVIIHSPGFEKLVSWVDRPILPTQATVGKILYAYAMERRVNMLAVDVGGATTDVYSVYNGVFNRSLNADIGLTYGISNIMKQAGVQNIMRWISKDMSEKEVRNILGNLMVLQPASLSSDEFVVQQAAAKEAIRIGVENHKKLASRLKGISVKGTLDRLFEQVLESTYLNMMKTQLIIGRGKVFTQCQTAEVAMILLDALQPEGITEMMIDKLSLAPHIGMLLDTNPEAAQQIFSKECLQRLGTCVGLSGKRDLGEEAMSVRMTKADASVLEATVPFGELTTIALDSGEKAELHVKPRKGLDVGKGKGKELVVEVVGGEMGLILDARGRPMTPPAKKEVLEKWLEALRQGQKALSSIKRSG